MYTLGENALAKIRRLCRAFGFSSEMREKGCDIFRQMSKEWFALPIKQEPYWPSDISDDNSPYELSISFDNNGARLRFLLEPSEYDGISEDLPFRPTRDMMEFFAKYANFDKDKRFHFWLACDMNEEDTLYKVYMNPKCAVEESKRGSINGHDVIYVSRDVLPKQQAREKIYFAYQNKDLAELSAWPAKKINKFVEKHAIPDDSPRKTLICYAYREESSTPEITIHFPVRFADKTDEQIARDIEELSGYQVLEALRRYSTLPLNESKGLISYVSWRLNKEVLRLTIYISSQVYSLPKVRFARCIEEIEEYGKYFLRTSLLYNLRLKKYSRPQLVEICRKMAYYVGTFQDIIRIIAEKCRVKELRPYVQSHCEEDMGHHIWYFNDLSKLTGHNMTALEMFDSKTASIRDLSQRILYLLADGQSVMRGIAMSFLLEELAEKFFPLMAKALNDKSLQYFGDTHIIAEQDHEIFQNDADIVFRNYLVTSYEFDEISDMLGEAYQIMVEMTRQLE